MLVPFFTSLIAIALEAVPFGASTPAVVTTPKALEPNPGTHHHLVRDVVQAVDVGMVERGFAFSGGSPAGSGDPPQYVRRDGGQGQGKWKDQGQGQGQQQGQGEGHQQGQGQGFDVIMRCTVPGTAALTFDDGPYIYSNDIVGMLKQANATGTFFYNGKNFGCIYDQDKVDRVKNAFYSGHQIASHTWSHTDLTTLSWDQINDEMWRVEDALNKILGIRPAFMRPPYGKYNDLVVRAASFRQESVTLWDFDSQDSSGASSEASKDLYTQLIAKHPDTILALNHETSDASVHQVLGFAIEKLQAAGYRLVSVAECLGRQPYSFYGHPQDRDANWRC